MNKLKIAALNSSSNAITSLLGNLLSLITLPLFLELYGDAQWGIYLWATSISGFLSSFDFGAKVGLRRFIARYSTTKDVKEVEIGLSLSIIIISSVALLNFVAIIIISFVPQNFLSLSDDYIETGRYILVFAAIFSLFFWGNKLLTSILEGFQLYKAKNLNIILSLVGQLIIFIYVWYYEPNFIQLAGLLFATRAIAFLLNLGYILYYKLLAGVTIRFSITKNDFQSDFFKFSIDVFILGILQLLIFKADIFILGAILGSAFVTKYVVITKPMFIIRTLDSYMFSAIQPMLAQEHANKNEDFLIKVLKKGNKVNFMIISPLCILIALLLEPFLNIWIDDRYNEFLMWGQLAVLMFMLKPFYNSIVKVMVNAGITKPMIRIRLVFALVTFLSSILFTVYLGLGGVIVGTFLGLLVNIPLYHRELQRQYSISFREMFSKSILYLHIYLLLMGFVSWYSLSVVVVSSWFVLLLVAVAMAVLLYGYSVYELIVKEQILVKLTTRN